MNRFEMRERLENKLTKKRFEHSLGVEYVSGCLAMVHGADVNKALTAGLLHDCAKCLPADEKIARCQKHGLPISQSNLLTLSFYTQSWEHITQEKNTELTMRTSDRL